MSDWPQKFLHAFSELHHYESISASHDELTLDDAYDIQRQFVALRSEPISGYKAALTALPAQQVMGVNEAIVGVLFASGDFSDAQPLQLNKQALLETELGFISAVDISKPVSEADVYANMRSCVPMIEIASPNLASKPNGIDLAATNSASYGYIIGKEANLEVCNLDQVHVTLAREDEQLQAGDSVEVMDGQRKALVWLINQVLARGYQISAGHLLMTGAIGGIQPAKPGRYCAEFAELGSIEFRIDPA